MNGIVGSRVPLVDGPLKASGSALYTADLTLPGMLHGAIVRSPEAHARIVSMELWRAMEEPGVSAVITGDSYPRSFGVLPITRDETMLAVGKVRFRGEGVAAVAATSPEAAQRAARQIKVIYERLPEYEDPEASAATVTEKIHAHSPGMTNLQKEVRQEFGPVEEAFRTAAHVVTVRGKFPGVTHAALEPHAVLAHYTPDDRLTVWSSTQVPHYLHRALSEVLDIPEHRVRVIKPEVGGGFGGKGDPMPHEIVAAALSRETGRPVRIVLSREEVFYLNHGRHPTRHTLKLAADAEGHLMGFDLDALIDGGAASSFGTVTTYYNGVLATGPYRIPAFRYHGRRGYTNRPASGAMRAHGSVNTRYSMEVAIDMLAEELRMDPMALRMRNFLSPHTTTINEFRITSNSVVRCLEASRARSSWDTKYRKLPVGRGIGVACGFFISGSNSPIHFTPPFPQSTVHLKIDVDGGVTIHSGASDIGQGSKTIVSQIVAEVLGIPLARVRVAAVDTDSAPVDLGSYSSRVTFMMGNAARCAAEDMLRQWQKAAEEITGRPSAEFRAHDGRLEAPGNISISYLEAVHQAMRHHGALQSSGAYESPSLGGKFKGARAGTSPAYSFAAYVAEVEVDVDLGRIHVKKVWAAFDCGRPLNPMLVEGQIEGSIHMGLGQLLGEEMRYRGTRLMNPSLLEYRTLSPVEMPEVECLLVGEEDPEGPFGAKEAGEGPLPPVLPAVANAVYDAVGLRFTELPLTPDRVWRALRQKERGGGLQKPPAPKVDAR
jgi:4-hydroxybenzoyl-CoA reductase alpha subunit